MMKILRKSPMLLATLFLCAILLVYFNNLKPHFNEVEKGYADNSRIINFSEETNPDELAELLVNNRYVKDTAEARLIADTLAGKDGRLKRMDFPNLYHLQKRDYGQIPIRVAEEKHVFDTVVKKSFKNVGLDSLFLAQSDSTLSVEKNLSEGDGEIRVHISPESDESVKGIVVRLQEHYSVEDKVVANHTVGFAKTDEQGNATFKGLDRKKGYSVLPIRKYYEYGGSKGIVEGNFDQYKYFGKLGHKEYVFEFQQLEHRIPMFTNATLKQIKRDGTITVRTPQDFKYVVVKWFVLVLLAWWLLAIVMVLRKRHFDSMLVSLAMLLTGLCVLVMFAIQNPLTEELRGVEMASGVLIGVGVILLFQFVDMVKVYQGSSKIAFDVPLTVVRWMFLPFKQKVSKIAVVLSGFAPWYKKLGAMMLLVCCLPFAIFNIPVISRVNKPIVRWIEKLPKGAGWLLLAIFLTALLWTPLGREIGGMKVNLSILGLTFQPSEIAKYLILLFMAAFFTQRADTIIAYSQPDRTRVLEKVKTLGWVIGGLLLLMAMYAALGDMGPALVIGVTFVLLYSLVKSKVNLEHLSDVDKWRRIFTCDFAVMIYGIVSFAGMTILGYWWNGPDTALLFAGLWFLAWIVLGILCHKQFFETALIINLLVFTFVFGGDIAKKVPVLRETSVAERFDERTNMCTNTWGNLDVHPDDPGYKHGKNAEEVSNTQVANGLWAIATGGMTGQGMGDGNPNLIPAFHTDMILSSIAEQIGWVGLVMVVLFIAFLLRRVVVVGYRVGHPFAFYFCMGVAIVTAVQFFIIALGSCGMIPLTGVTVPFLSYGRVSMILNLTAIGIVLSLSKNIRQEQLTETEEHVRRRSVGDYNYPVSIVTWCYVFLALFTLGVWQYYALWMRDDTLIHPAYTHTREGIPIIEYNPRIALLTSEMWSGNIYDRNGVLLATSDREKLMSREVKLKLQKSGVDSADVQKIMDACTKRYYPFAEDMFFMLGDYNTGMYSIYDENNPVGYLAELQHQDYLRGFNTSYYDKNGNPIKVTLDGTVNVDARYLRAAYRDTIVTPNIRDYSELLPYLKDGTQGKLLKEHNEKVRNGGCDLKLTVDAALQKDLQTRIQKYVDDNDLNNNGLLRVSVVVLDAQNGDLLTSANYPLPDYKRIKQEEDLARNSHRSISYNDNGRGYDWKAYTDRDLGLTYATAPGSTAKVMSAMAGLQKLGVSAAEKKYLVDEKEIVENGSAREPYGDEEVTMRDAIVKSSNCYFINLVNDCELYNNLGNIYEAVGIRIGGITPYYLSYKINPRKLLQFQTTIQEVGDRGVKKYRQYKEGTELRKMNDQDWQWAWGQGTLDATPLNMARVASAVVNKGVMPATQFVMPTNVRTRALRCGVDVPLLQGPASERLYGFMKEEAASQHSRQGGAVNLPSYMGGKTGTPERPHYFRSKTVYNARMGKNVTYYYNESQKTWQGVPQIKNDGWYMFFVERDGKHPLAVCVRMERGTGSGAAVRLSEKVVLAALKDNGYISR